MFLILIIMNLEFDSSLSHNYKSKSQIARVLTEAWFAEQMYCPACTSNTLDPLKANTKVVDFQCPKCASIYQLKAMSHKFGNKVMNGAYAPKIEMINNRTSPNWAFMQYDNNDWTVERLILVPAHFVTAEIVEQRKPLSQKARRAGWRGSNILLGMLPPDARLPVIIDGKIVPKNKVRDDWKRFEFYKRKRQHTKGWLNDVLSCVRELDKKEFTLKEMYAFAPKLKRLHPENHNIEPKIRQQLQILRDHGLLQFQSRGRYRVETIKYHTS